MNIPGAAPLIDAEQLVYTLLKRDVESRIAEVLVLADLDVDSIENLPVVTYALSGGGQESNGRGLWEYTLSLNMFAEDNDAFDVAKAVYEAVWSWDEPGVAVLPGIGSVNAVADVSAPSRLVSGVQMIGKHVTQYTAAFALTLHN